MSTPVQISDLGELSRLLKGGKSALVALNMNGRGDEVGIAYMPLINPDPSRDLKQFAVEQDILLRYFQVCDRKKLEHRQEPFFWREQTEMFEYIDAAAVQQKIVKFLEHVRMISGLADVTLIVHGVAACPRWFNDYISEVLPSVSSWADVQSLTQQADLMNKPDLMNHPYRRPSLTTCLRAFHSLEFCSHNNRPCSGNNAVRILAVLSCLSSIPEAGKPLCLNQLLGRKLLWPFAYGYQSLKDTTDAEVMVAAMVRMEDGKCPGKELLHSDDAWKYFRRYHPVALAWEGHHFKTHSEPGDCGRYLVGFAHPQHVLKFIKEQNQTRLSCGRRLYVTLSVPRNREHKMSGSERPNTTPHPAFNVVERATHVHHVEFPSDQGPGDLSPTSMWSKTSTSSSNPTTISSSDLDDNKHRIIDYEDPSYDESLAFIKDMEGMLLTE